MNIYPTVQFKLILCNNAKLAMLMTIQWGDVAWEKSPSDNCWLQGSPPADDDGDGSSLFPDYGRCHCWLLIFLSLSVGARCWCSLCQSSLLVDGSVTLGESGSLARSLPSCFLYSVTHVRIIMKFSLFSSIWVGWIDYLCEKARWCILWSMRID